MDNLFHSCKLLQWLIALPIKKKEVAPYFHLYFFQLRLPAIGPHFALSAQLKSTVMSNTIFLCRYLQVKLLFTLHSGTLNRITSFTLISMYFFFSRPPIIFTVLLFSHSLSKVFLKAEYHT